MLTNTEIILSVIALGLAAIGTIAATAFALFELADYIRRRIQFTQVWNEAHIEHQLYESLNKLLYAKPVPNYRHNIHCPSCGRFAKRVLGMDKVVECRAHGVQFREWDVPVDWVTVPIAEGVTLFTQPVVIPYTFVEPVYELNAEPEPKDFTGSIAIITSNEVAAIGA